MFLFKFIDDSAPNEIISQIIKTGIIKNLIWTIPAIILINKYDGILSVKFRNLFNTKINWLSFLLMLIVFSVYLLTGSILKNNGLAISSSFGLPNIIIVIFVGLTEELVFRGLLFNAFYNEKNKIKSYIINALLFLLIHFPKWLATGVFIASFTNLSFIAIIVLSIIFSYSFIKNKSIVPPIMLHMYWDLLMFIFY